MAALSKDFHIGSVWLLSSLQLLMIILSIHFEFFNPTSLSLLFVASSVLAALVQTHIVTQEGPINNFTFLTAARLYCRCLFFISWN